MRTRLRRVIRRISGDEIRTDGGTAEPEPSSIRAFLDRDIVQSSPFWLPAFLLMGLFVYGAILWNVLISLTDYPPDNSIGLGSPNYGQLDFDNYRKAFGLMEAEGVDTIYNAGENTLILMVVFTVACLVLGLLLAILVDQDIRFENTFRTIYLLPMSISFVVTAKFWLWMYQPNGLLNIIVGMFGGGNVEWLSPKLRLWSIIFALVWQYSGYAMVVYLAGLRAIPDDHFEAARVDGASTVRMYWRVIIPQLRTATISAAVVLMVFSLKAFDFLYSLFGNSNPGPSADILATQMVRALYGRNNLSYAAAIAVILFALALVVIAPYLYSQYKRGDL